MNENNTTENLIKELTSNHKKISVESSPLIRTISFSFILTSLSIVLMNLHQPLIITIKNTQHIIELFLSIIFYFTVVYIGFNSFVPGSKKKNRRILLFISIVSSFLLLILTSLSPQTFNTMREFCEIEAISISFFTTLVSHFLLKKNEYAQSTITSSFVILGLPMLASILLHSSCSLELSHVILCHVAAPLMIPIIYLATRTYWLK